MENEPELLQWLEKPGDEQTKKDQLHRYVAELIERDFEKLVWLLYRVDVNEAELKASLKETTPENAAAVITQKILTRLEQKAESRKNFRTDASASEEEKW